MSTEKEPVTKVAKKCTARVRMSKASRISSSTGAIVGGVVGGVVGAALILGLTFFLIQKRKKPTAPSTAASWKSGPSVGNPFEDVVRLRAFPRLPQLSTDIALTEHKEGHGKVTYIIMISNETIN